MNKITAIRGNDKRVFSLSAWQMMPLSKYGWKQVADEPEVVKAFMNIPEDVSIKEYSEAIRAARKSGDVDKLKSILNAKAI